MSRIINTFLIIIFFWSHAIAQKAPSTFQNPIIPGFHPDPSICRVGNDYYLVNSSFEWFPGIPIFHSKDLVNWEQIGHVLDRPSQLAMNPGMKASNGIWAPTLRHNKGIFYVIVTCQDCGGNFYVTAQKPEGPWSDPIFIQDSPGIDPELFFDDNGKTYYVGSSQGKWGPPRCWTWEDRIYIQEIDLKTGILKGEKTHLTSGHASNAKWCEGPHIYKHDGKYFLFVSEGGTWNNHSVTCHVADSVKGPYIPIDANPVLTHRHLGNLADITTIGHADLVETQNGDWYAVMLGVRPMQGFRNLGRETFLTSLEWQGNQPVFNPGKGPVLMEDIRPNLAWSPMTELPVTDNFDNPKLNFHWNFLRTPFEKWYSLEMKKDWLQVSLRPEQLTEPVNPSLIARRQEHHSFEAYTRMSFKPETENESAGLVVFQNDRFHFRLLLILEDGNQYIQLVKAGNSGMEFRNRLIEEEIARIPFHENTVVIGVKASNLDYQFYFGSTHTNMEPIGKLQDGRILSSNWAGGFTGTYIGMYATSKNKISTNSAFFDWFSYQEGSKN
jgi:xylan 1,4-beta-xylosidase